MNGKRHHARKGDVNTDCARPDPFADLKAKLSRKTLIDKAIDQELLALADAGKTPKEIWVILKQRYPGRWKTQGPIKTRLSRLLARRANPSREEFIERWKGPMLEMATEQALAQSNLKTPLTPLTRALVNSLCRLGDDIVVILGDCYGLGVRTGEIECYGGIPTVMFAFQKGRFKFSAWFRLGTPNEAVLVEKGCAAA